MEKVCLVFTIKEMWDIILQNDTEEVRSREQE